jgi:glycosyltransferase involved in cell wall biosynthesis
MPFSDCTERTLIVVPTFNEERRLNQNAFLQACQKYATVDFLFVNDGSSDRTVDIIRTMTTESPQISLLNLETNQGKGEAVRLGFLQGLSKNYGFIGYWDADLATPLSAITNLMGEFDRKPQLQVVIGSRVKLLGRDIHRRAFRHYIGRCFATGVSITLNLGVYDTQCGAKIFKNTPTLHKSFANRFISKWVFDVEILARLQRAGMDLGEVVAEFPLWQWRDVSGSNLKLGDFVRAARDLALIAISMKTDKRLGNGHF